MLLCYFPFFTWGIASHILIIYVYTYIDIDTEVCVCKYISESHKETARIKTKMVDF